MLHVFHEKSLYQYEISINSLIPKNQQFIILENEGKTLYVAENRAFHT